MSAAVRPAGPADVAGGDGGGDAGADLGEIARWLALLDGAERLMGWGADPDDPHAQRAAGRALDALAAYEHTIAPEARRAAREAAWRRDHPDQPLSAGPWHPPSERPPAGCVCAACRAEWARCRCRRCLAERLLGWRADGPGPPSPLPALVRTAARPPRPPTARQDPLFPRAALSAKPSIVGPPP